METANAYLGSLAFGIALLTFLLAVLVLQVGSERSRAQRLLALYLVLFAGQEALLALQSAVGWNVLGFLRVLFLLAANPILFHFFEVTRREPVDRVSLVSVAVWLHGVPVLLALGLFTTGHDVLIDPLLALSFLGYGLWFGWLSFRKQERNAASSSLRPWLLAAGLYFLVCSILDPVIDWQISSHGTLGGSWMLLLVLPGILLLVFFLVLGLANRRPAFHWLLDLGRDRRAHSDSYAREELQDIARRIQVLLRDPKTFEDPDLTITRLARRMGEPVRKVSTALNQELGFTFSQYLSRVRIKAALSRMAEDVDETHSILDIAYGVGFGSKSNFNKEFKRLTGLTPSNYRAYARLGQLGDRERILADLE